MYIGGNYEDQQESFSSLIWLLLLSLMLVYIVMAAQFESFKMPFIIMLAIPFAFTGVILALLLTNTTLSIVAALGAIMLVGIVTKNGIVLIDFINLMRERGIRLYDAIAHSLSFPSASGIDDLFDYDLWVWCRWRSVQEKVPKPGGRWVSQ